MSHDRRLDQTAIIGEGLIDRLAAILRDRDLSPSRAAIVIDPALSHGPIGQRVTGALGPAAPAFRVAPGEPTAGDIDRLALWLRTTDPEVVIAVGGGSVLDAAKLATAITDAADDRPNSAAYACGATPLPTRRRALIAVPTTAGTGSEATRTTVYALSSGAKVWAWGDRIGFDAAILDPIVTIGLPPPLTAMTGADAIVHAIESLTNRREDADAVRFAEASLKLAGQHLVPAVLDGANLPARAGMLEAAYWAGRAIDLTGCAMAHGLGHALGTVLKMPHGRAVALSLAAILPVNVRAAPDAHAGAARALNLGADLPVAFDGLLDQIGFAELPPIAADDAHRSAVIASLMAPENQPMCDVNAAPLSAFDLPAVTRAVLP